MENTKRQQLKTFILDVDGVLTDGKYYYTTEGKVMKVFGPDDHDALLLLKNYLDIIMITGDKKGLPISEKRVVQDMKFPLYAVSTFERIKWIKENYNLDSVIYMGDGIFDGVIFDKVAYGIAPSNAFYKTKEKAHYITQHAGGDSAVAEACVHILEKFFVPVDFNNLMLKEGQGEWGE
ncbi:phosphatase [bacterium (Candidatus Gribaldobacteria) CG_4_10_14_0_2_um_filter_41_16]|uniref:Phosphatase n=1 Tax=bacterium (Candidatus Gribaldobacteria) CG_4_10_14_0_2_um_filter_41_16 TaxID=2014265 RepID=A0A2M7VIF9_9BACT|nr:MAG: phosphatase [bacterium (Candidatus Gribaldobacteria) CG_4_10_14_0_2_um_filter_41_16]